MPRRPAATAKEQPAGEPASGPEERRRKAAAELERLRRELGDDAVEAALRSARAEEELSAIGERRVVSALFADFAGFTAMVAREDPASLRGLLARAFEALVPVIEGYGGTIEKFIGDGVMALFGAPESREDDATRACLSALAMRRALRDFNEREGASLAMHFGIGSGAVIAGPVGTAAYRSYAALGDAINRAARLSASTDPGDILTDAATRNLAAADCRFESVGALELKGFDKPVPAYRLLAAAPASSGGSGLAAAGPSSGPSPFVGRQAELAALDACLQNAGQAAAKAAVLGEPGIGKSRLMREFIRSLGGGDAVLALSAAARSFQTRCAYAFWGNLIDGLAGVAMDDSLAVRRSRFSSWLEGLGTPEGERLLLETLCGLEEPETKASEAEECCLEAEAGAFEAEAAAAILALIGRLSAGRRVALVCEDFHWADRPSTSLLSALLALRWPSGSLCIAASRDAGFLAEERARDIGWTVVRIAGLSEAEGAELAAALNPELDAEALSSAAGNPFFIEELAKAPPPGRCQAREGGRTELFRMIAARIDSFGQEVAESVRMAAALGDRFPLSLLSALGGRASADQLARTGLFAVEPDAQLWSFRHGILRDVALEFYPAEARAALHARAAKTIKRLFPDYALLHPEVLATHWRLAGESRRALPYYESAVRRSLARLADAEALALLGLALPLASPASPLHEAALRLLAGQALSRLGRADEALAELDAALAIQRGLANASQMIYLIRTKGFTLWRAGRLEGAEEAFAEAAAMAETADILVERLRVRLDRAWLRSIEGGGPSVVEEIRACMSLAMERGRWQIVDRAEKLLAEAERQRTA